MNDNSHPSKYRTDCKRPADGMKEVFLYERYEAVHQYTISFWMRSPAMMRTFHSLFVFSFMPTCCLLVSPDIGNETLREWGLKKTSSRNNRSKSNPFKRDIINLLNCFDTTLRNKKVQKLKWKPGKLFAKFKSKIERQLKCPRQPSFHKW